MSVSTDNRKANQAIERKARRPVLVIVMIVSLISVIIFRVIQDRRRAADAIKYADLHEAVAALSDLLVKTPKNERLPLVIHYLNSESPGMRYAAVDALDNAHSAAVAEALERAYLDSSAEVRKHVLDILPKFDVQRGYRLQLAALQDEDSWVRDHAIFLLSSNIRQRKTYVDRRAVPVLMHTISDTDPNITPLSLPVLKKLTGVTGNGWRYSILDDNAHKDQVKARWLNWWSEHSGEWPASDREYESIGSITPTRQDAAPDFLVKDIDGNRLSLESLRGKVVLLNFWGTWCPPCQGEIPALVNLDQMYKGRGLETIGIAIKENSVDTLRGWCRAHDVNYPQVLDADAIAHVYGDVYEVPVSILIDKRGAIRRRWDGERDYDTFRVAVERLLKE